LAAQEEDVDDGQGQVPQSLEQIGQWMQAGRNTIEDDMTTMTGVGVKEERGEGTVYSGFVPFFNGNFGEDRTHEFIADDLIEDWRQEWGDYDDDYDD
jgi:hypothetical protein